MPHRKTGGRSPRFVLIGVGSAVFGARTLGDLIHFREVLDGAIIALVDIDPHVLGLMTTLATKMNDAAGRPFVIESSTERRDVLPDADFVVTSPAIKREALWEKDWNIIRRAGIKMTYGENGGPGSLSHTLRNVPMILDICRDVEDLAPDAWVLNFTNPEARICMAIARHTRLKFVGLCHQIHVGYRMIAEALGLPVEDLDVKAAGLNHFTWAYDIRRQSTGEDLYPRLREVVGGEGIAGEPLTTRMFELTGLFPMPGDHHLAEFLPFGYEFVGLEGRDFAEWRRGKAEKVAWLEGVAGGTSEIEEVVSGLSGERVAQMAVAILTNGNSFEVSLDVVNNGTIPNLPDDAIVEAPGVISGAGVAPLRMAALPDEIAEWARRQVTVQALSVEAAVSGDRRTALRAMALDPVVDSYAAAQKVLDELLEAHREYVSPRFFDAGAGKVEAENTPA